MTAKFNGALLAVAADFCGKWTPYTGVQIRPNRNGSGVFVASTDAGRLAFLAFDENGSADEELCLLATSDLLKHTKPLKSASRWIEIEGSIARCSKLTKSTTTTVEVPVTYSTVEPPDLVGAMHKVALQWGKDQPHCVDCGNFNGSFLTRAFKAIEVLGGSVTMSHLNGGPLRVESTDHDVIVLVMPETARPIPALPAFLKSFSVS